GPERRELLVPGPLEIEPPEREDDEEAPGDDRKQADRARARLGGGADGDRGREDGLPERDEGEETVALGDVLRVPGRGRRALRPRRYPQLDRGQRPEAHEAQLPGQEETRRPSDLHEDDPPRVAPRATPTPPHR